MTLKTDRCQLEVDQERGVVYVHGPKGQTLVRISKIPTRLFWGSTLDVTFDRELAALIERHGGVGIPKDEGEFDAYDPPEKCCG